MEADFLSKKLREIETLFNETRDLLGTKYRLKGYHEKAKELYTKCLQIKELFGDTSDKKLEEDFYPILLAAKKLYEADLKIGHSYQNIFKEVNIKLLELIVHFEIIKVSNNKSINGLETSFDERHFYKRIVDSSRELFISQAKNSIRSSILATCHGYRDYIRNIIDSNKDGQKLMFEAFKLENEKAIKINNLSNETEIDEQKGIGFLSAGIFAAIRNFLEHGTDEIPIQTALDMLSVISYVWSAVETKYNKISVDKFISSKSYNEANENSKVIAIIFGDLDNENKNKILNNAAINRQIIDGTDSREVIIEILKNNSKVISSEDCSLNSEIKTFLKHKYLDKKP